MSRYTPSPESSLTNTANTFTNQFGICFVGDFLNPALFDWNYIPAKDSIVDTANQLSAMDKK